MKNVLFFKRKLCYNSIYLIFKAQIIKYFCDFTKIFSKLLKNIFIHYNFGL